VKRRILFLCTGNSIRSQMAEGLANAFHGDEVEAVSAGSRPSGVVHPMAIRAMAEKGIDIAAARSKNAAEFQEQDFDIVVTVCDSAAQDCPLWPGARRIEHWPIPDPFYGPDYGTDEPMARFREVRDDLERRIAALLAQ
jgi:arsenate reductase